MNKNLTLALAASMFALTLAAFPHYASATPTTAPVLAPSPAAIDIFLQLDGIPGETIAEPTPTISKATSDLFVLVPYIYWDLLAPR